MSSGSGKSDGTNSISRAAEQALSDAGIIKALDEIANNAGYRAYKPDSHSAFEKAVAALNAFFISGQIQAAETEIASFATEDDAALALRTLRAYGADNAVSLKVVANIIRALPDADEREVSLRVDEAIGNALLEMLVQKDTSRPLDAIDGQKVIVCYVPGGADQNGIVGPLTNWMGMGSGCCSIDPNETFADFLRLANVSSDEYAAMVKRAFGVDLYENERWRAFSVPTARPGPALVTEKQLIEGVDGAAYGFTPLIAFSANARHLIERDWSLPLVVEGGILGLHNFANGSGHPQRFEEPISISASPASFAIGERRENDFGETYGFVRPTFDSIVSDASEMSLRPL